jgi:hypothetical protein
MEVISFLLVSVGSGIVVTVKVADAHAHLPTMVSVVKMASVLKCTTEEQRSDVQFLWADGLNAKDIHKEMFPVYDGKCLLCKAFHNWVEIFSQGRSTVADQVRKWLRQQSKDFYAADFDALVKH